MFFIAQFSGMYPMRPFLVQILKAYESPIPADKTTAIMSFMELLATITFTCLVRFTGKRKFYLTMCFGVFISSAVLSLYGFILLPMGYISFDLTHQTLHLENTLLPYIPLICLFLWSFLSYCGFLAMPWMLLSEIFPFKYVFGNNLFSFNYPYVTFEFAHKSFSCIHCLSKTNT